LSLHPPPQPLVSLSASQPAPSMPRSPLSRYFGWALKDAGGEGLAASLIAL